MTDDNTPRVEVSDSDEETFPLEPRYHPLHRIPRLIYDVLASAKLAMALLIIILICCLTGATVWRGVEAGRLIFGTIWFNSILVLLVVNIACCFFGRIWGRRITIVSFGMILFHLSFVVMLLAIIYNSLFYFRGTIRVTEGESIPSYDPLSYDLLAKGRFFNFSHLKGDTTLIKMHTGYKIGDEDKRAAYEVSVGEEGTTKQGFIYTTHKLSHKGVDYFNEKEGYSLLLMLADKQGKDIYGVHVPLQSIQVSKDSFSYATGYIDKAKREIKKDTIPFPAAPESPLFALKAEYIPAKQKERAGDVMFSTYSLDDKGMPDYNRQIAEGKTPVGTPFSAGEYLLTAKEVRYWVGMTVRYEPGKPILLTSLWVGLIGMIITTIGRMMRGQKSNKTP